MINGYESFNIMLELQHPTDDPKPWAGSMHTYIYYPEMYNVPYGDHVYPDGLCQKASNDYRMTPCDPMRGPYFVPRPAHRTENDRWYCYEFMVKLNTVKDGIVRRDGRVAAWADGELVYDFPNIIIRRTEELKININRLLLNNSHNRAEFGHETYKMVTNYVLATEYIGPAEFV